MISGNFVVVFFKWQIFSQGGVPPGRAWWDTPDRVQGPAQGPCRWTCLGGPIDRTRDTPLDRRYPSPGQDRTGRYASCGHTALSCLILLIFQVTLTTLFIFVWECDYCYTLKKFFSCVSRLTVTEISSFQSLIFKLYRIFDVCFQLT